MLYFQYFLDLGTSGLVYVFSGILLVTFLFVYERFVNATFYVFDVFLNERLFTSMV